MEITKENKEQYQELFDYLEKQYGLILTIEGMNDLIAKIDKTRNLFNPPNSLRKGSTICELDGKKVLVKFKVTKHIPKVIIEDI